LLLYFWLPESISAGPRWLVPALELVLVVPLTVYAPYRHAEEQRIARAASLFLLGVVIVADGISLLFLINAVVTGGLNDGGELVRSGAVIWLSMVIGFGLLFWELDSGGPAARARPDPAEPDFLFPQMGTHEIGQQDWMPRFFDYLYVSFTNSTAFSPTDTLPLTQRAKLLMLIEAMSAITTVVMVVGRAVNVLK
jgi:hypothetical protein